MLPLFRELAWLLPDATLDIDLVGPVAFDLPPKPIVYEGAAGGVFGHMMSGPATQLPLEGLTTQRRLPPGVDEASM